MLLSLLADKWSIRAAVLKQRKEGIAVKAVSEAPLSGGADLWEEADWDQVAGALCPALGGSTPTRAVLTLCPDWYTGYEHIYQGMPRAAARAAGKNDLRLICGAQDDSSHVLYSRVLYSGRRAKGRLFPDRVVGAAAVRREVVSAFSRLLKRIGVRKHIMGDYSAGIYTALRRGSGPEGGFALCLNDRAAGLYYAGPDGLIGRGVRWAYCGPRGNEAARAEELTRRFLSRAADGKKPDAFFIGPERICGEIMDRLPEEFGSLRAGLAYPKHVAASGLPDHYALPVWCALSAIRDRKELALWML